MKKIFTFIIFSFLTTYLFSQDKIYKLKGPVINAKIIEIGTDEI